MKKYAILLPRISLGCLMLYAGLSKILNPEWTAKGYLLSAKTFAGFYNWLASAPVLPTIDFINQWALLLLGISLITGIALRLSGPLGACLMLLYYLPVLQFPYVAHSFVVDEHIVYATLLIFFAVTEQPNVLPALRNKLASLRKSSNMGSL